MNRIGGDRRAPPCERGGEMSDKLTNLTHLRMVAESSRELSAQVAQAAAEALEELAAAAATMEQVDAAIDRAVTGAVEEAY